MREDVGVSLLSFAHNRAVVNRRPEATARRLRWNAPNLGRLRIGSSAMMPSLEGNPGGMTGIVR